MLESKAVTVRTDAYPDRGEWIWNMADQPWERKQPSTRMKFTSHSGVQRQCLWQLGEDGTMVEVGTAF